MVAFRKSRTNNAEFEKLLDNMSDAMHDRISAELRKNANSLAEDIRSSAPSEDGDLRASVRIEDRTDQRNPKVYVRAGGQKTTKTTAAGPYDYANATEFGTAKQSARPFFYPTVRRRLPGIRKNIDRALRTVLDLNVKTGRTR